MSAEAKWQNHVLVSLQAMFERFEQELSALKGKFEQAVGQAVTVVIMFLRVSCSWVEMSNGPPARKTWRHAVCTTAKPPFSPFTKENSSRNCPFSRQVQS